LRAINIDGSTYINEWWADGASSIDCHGAQAISLSSNSYTSGKDFYLDSGAVTITGTVYQSDGMIPVTGQAAFLPRR